MNCGRIVIWKYTDSRSLRKASTSEMCQWGNFAKPLDSVSCCVEPESCWLQQPIVDLLVNHTEEHLRDSCVNTAVNMLEWDMSKDKLVATYEFSTGKFEEVEVVKEKKTNINSIYVLYQQPLCASIGGGGSGVMQISSQHLAVVSSNPAQFAKSEDTDLVTVRTNLSNESTLCKSFTKPIESTEAVISVEEQLRRAFCTKVSPSVLQKSYFSPCRNTWLFGMDTNSVYTNTNFPKIFHLFVSLTNDFSYFFLLPPATFACEFELIGMYEQNILTREDYKIHIRNLQGTVKQLITFPETDGPITMTALCNGYMACLTENGVLKILDLTKK